MISFTYQLMRKTAAILLLLLIVFNTIGYKLWFSIAMEKADTKLEKVVDNLQYNAAELFTLKIPLNLPYQNISANFERVNGEITVNGETYMFVQRKVEKDTMYLQCIRNNEKNILKQRSNDFFSKMNDVAGNNDSKKIPGKNSSLIKFTGSDFTNDISLWKVSPTLSATVVYLLKPFCLNSFYHRDKMIKPPQIC